MTEAKVIDTDFHSRLIADKDHLCEVAGLQPKYLMESMTKYCKETEVDWVRKFPQYRAEGLPGLILTKVENPDTRCQAICGALIRNYVDARVIPVNTMMDMHDAGHGDAITPTVVLIPNMFVTVSGKSVPAWKVQILYDMLLARSVQSKPTVAYVEDMTTLMAQFGKPFADFLSGFRMVKGQVV